MRIAVIGTGNVGGALGQRWRGAGHDVVYGGRSAGRQGPGGAPVLPVADALVGADVVVLAVPGPAVADVIAPHGAALDGRVVIDAANNIGGAQVNSHAAVAAAAPGAYYARAFNTLGWENFIDPPPGAVLFYAADAGARPATEELITAVGLEPVLAGDASAAGAVDSLLPLWFALMQQHGGNRRIALRVTQ
jgi:predicted dinucleotide-binding enzyme